LGGSDFILGFRKITLEFRIRLPLAEDDSGARDLAQLPVAKCKQLAVLNSRAALVSALDPLTIWGLIVKPEMRRFWEFFYWHWHVLRPNCQRLLPILKYA